MKAKATPAENQSASPAQPATLDDSVAPAGFYRCPACGEAVSRTDIAAIRWHHRHVLAPPPPPAPPWYPSNATLHQLKGLHPIARSPLAKKNAAKKASGKCPLSRDGRRQSRPILPAGLDNRGDQAR